MLKTLTSYITGKPCHIAISAICAIQAFPKDPFGDQRTRIETTNGGVLFVKEPPEEILSGTSLEEILGPKETFGGYTVQLKMVNNKIVIHVDHSNLGVSYCLQIDEQGMRKARMKKRLSDDQEFSGNDNYGKPRYHYLVKLWWMSDAALLKETEQVIWLSAFAGNNPRSDYHWHVSACYREWDRRGKEDQYTVAFNAASKG
jgi:hypothetical protein